MAEKIEICLKEEGVVGLEYVCMKEREGGLDTPQEKELEIPGFFSQEIETSIKDAKSKKVHMSLNLGAFGSSAKIFYSLEKLGVNRICEGYRVVDDNSLFKEIT
ncbi:uncharacterized protein LOC111711217 [Eurytemora carolleeae]|uniref:uncharacterized protein LOC111711217 n=1 Tax=Eurytemora carolleeae TaxID=1294199 RepID=UPI000C785ECE|nr:uncharacterized protein LOC111711217 [Eurytemora carolleeae]|eukprot:XP_023341274.1 uncharacterized protein LOC111711217 [Eurytemora affinis]